MLKLDPKIVDLLPFVRSTRRHFHMFPEIGFAEFKTQSKILEILSQFPLDSIQKIAKTGVKAVLMGRTGEKTIAFRSDIDALPVEEKNSHDFVSKHKGFMHACGHDAHMAILLGFIKYICAFKGKIDENLVFIFQPAEEGEGGAEGVIADGGLDSPKVDYIFGFHVSSNVSENRIGFLPGAFMASVADFDLILLGKGGHGAMPHTANDLISVSSLIINSFQQIISRGINPQFPAVLTVGKLQAGTKRNVLPDVLLMEGTVRTSMDGLEDNIKNKMTDILEGFKTAFNIDYNFKFFKSFPALANDETLCDKVRIHLHDHFEKPLASMGGEDFSYYQRKVPGLFMYIGINNEQKGFCHPIHSPFFNLDEEALLYAIQLYGEIIFNKVYR